NFALVFSLHADFLSGYVVVFGFVDALKVFVEPADDVLQALHAMPGLSRAGELVRLAGEADHDHWPLQELEGTEHFLATGSRRSAIVGFAQHEHERSLDVLDIGDWRALHIILRILKRRGLEPRGLVEGEVGGVPPVSPTGDIALRNGSSKAVGMADDPV